MRCSWALGIGQTGHWPNRALEEYLTFLRTAIYGKISREINQKIRGKINILIALFTGFLTH